VSTEANGKLSKGGNNVRSAKGGPMIRTKVISIGLMAMLSGLTAGAQSATVSAVDAKPACASQVPSTYLLGPEDQLQITGADLDEPVGKLVGIDGEGDIQVPLVGRVHVAGLTVQQAEKELNSRLAKFIKNPQVALDVKELRSQPVSIGGQVNAPGVHQVSGHKTLMEMISMAGGTKPDAGYSIRITRQAQWGCIPLPGATVDPSGYSVAQVSLTDIMEAKRPEENIQILPHDLITVPKAEMIFVTGAVKKSGGFVLGEHQTMSVLQALALAEGFGPAPDTKHAQIIRKVGDQKTEIPVDLKALMQRKGQDVAMQGNDILFIPDSTGKRIALRVMEAAIQTGTGLAIYRP
jgi:polysaccharide biosynthesis/export protein